MKRILAALAFSFLAALSLPLGCQSACDAHDDCESDEVCVFSIHTCAPKCGDEKPCATGMYCSTCATSSCDVCKDCVQACLSISGGSNQGAQGGW